MWTMGIMVICMLSKLFCYKVSSLNMTLFEIFCQCIRWPTSKEFAYQCRRCRNAGLISGSGRAPGGGNGNPLQNSCLENSMDRGAWQATVHRVVKSQTWQHTAVGYSTTWFAVEYRVQMQRTDYQVIPRFLTVEKEMVPLTPILLKGQLYTYYHYVVYLN